MQSLKNLPCCTRGSGQWLNAVKDRMGSVRAAEMECNIMSIDFFIPKTKLVGEQVFTNPRSQIMHAHSTPVLSCLLWLMQTTGLAATHLSDLTGCYSPLCSLASVHVSLSAFQEYSRPAPALELLLWLFFLPERGREIGMPGLEGCPIK